MSASPPASPSLSGSSDVMPQPLLYFAAKSAGSGKSAEGCYFSENLSVREKITRLIDSSLKGQLAATSVCLSEYIKKAQQLEGSPRLNQEEFKQIESLAEVSIALAASLAAHRGTLLNIKEPSTAEAKEIKKLVKTLEDQEYELWELFRAAIEPFQESFKDLHRPLLHRIQNLSSFVKEETPYDFLCNHRSTYIHYVVVGQDSKLTYSKTPCLYGGVDKEVIAALEQHIDSLVVQWKKEYEEAIQQENWEKRAFLEKKAEGMINGLSAMEQGYSRYPNFCSYLGIKEDFLQGTVKDGLEAMDEKIEVVAESPEATLYDLLSLRCPSYELRHVRALMKDSYGPTLTGCVIEKYLDKPHDSPHRAIGFEELQFLLIAVACEVRVEHLEETYKKTYPDKQSLASLSNEELYHLILSFRRHPKTGQSLLDAFAIPRRWEKQVIDPHYMAKMKHETRVQNYRKAAIKLLADIEASDLWAPKRRVRRDRDHLLERLTKYLGQPTKENLFSPNPYHHFLDLVTMGLALLERCQESSQCVELELQPFIKALKYTRIASGWSLSQKDLRPIYQLLFLRLIETLEECVKSQNFCSDPLIDILGTHPMQSSIDRLDPAALARYLAPHEYCARRIAYASGYLGLQNAALYMDKEGKHLNKADARSLEGAFFILHEKRGPVVYTVHLAEQQPGHYAHLLMPVEVSYYKRQGLPIPAHILFQGTADSFSVERDKQVSAPGYDLWKERDREDGLHPLIAPLVKKAQEVAGDTALSFYLTGHSLGGAEAFYALWQFAYFFEKHPELMKKISVRVYAFQVPRLSQEVPKDFLHVRGEIKAALLKQGSEELAAQQLLEHALGAFPSERSQGNFEDYHIHCRVPGDYVNEAGESHIEGLVLNGEFPNKHGAELQNLYSRHRIYVCAHGYLKALRILCHKQDEEELERYFQAQSKGNSRFLWQGLKQLYGQDYHAIQEGVIHRLHELGQFQLNHLADPSWYETRLRWAQDRSHDVHLGLVPLMLNSAESPNKRI